MKYNIFNLRLLPVCAFVFLIGILFSSCEKDKDGMPTVSPGQPVASKISPLEGGGGTLLTIEGSGLGDIRSIVFKNGEVAAAFTGTLNTGNAILFRVPDNANGGEQDITLVNSKGASASIKFNVLAFPVVNSVFPNDFKEGSLITIAGNNLNDVHTVTLTGATAGAEIVSQTKEELVVKMPRSSLDRARLTIENVTGELALTSDFINMDRATVLIEGDFVKPAESWSWGISSIGASTDYAVTGESSMKVAFDPNGDWGGLQIGMSPQLQVPAGTRYFSFWARAADVNAQFTFKIDGNAGGKEKTISVPANGRWNYYREDLSSFYPGLQSINLILLQIHGKGSTVYLDNMMLYK